MRKFLLFSAVFIALFLGVFYANYLHWGQFSGWVTDSDYYFHWSKANGECPERYYSYETCVGYSPLLGMLTKVFAGNEWGFNLFQIFMVGFLIPFILYMKTKSDWSYLIYFSSVFVFNIMFASIFAHALLALIFSLLLISKKPFSFWTGALFVLGIFSHSQGLYVLTALMLYKIYERYRFHFSKWIEYGMYGGVFSLLPKHREDMFTLNHFVMLGSPLNWYFSLFLKNSQKLLLIFFLIGAIVVNYRSILFIPLLWAVWLPEYIEKSPAKVGIAVVLLLYIVMQFAIFITQITPATPII